MFFTHPQILSGNTAENRIKQIPIGTALKTLLLVKEVRKTGLRLTHTIIKVFFIPQFLSRFGFRKRSVVQIDHPLDSKIPFAAGHVRDYLCFTHIWIKSLCFLYLEFGEKIIPELLAFIGELESFYRGSFTIYDHYQSTTRRPKSGGGLPFFLIRLLDPHLHCLPSLHVIIAAYTAFTISSILDKYAAEKDGYKPEKDHLFTMAVRIINSVLFIKQHSVNCVPAGLFMLQCRISAITSKHSGILLDTILQEPEIPAESREEIVMYMKTLLHRFVEQGEDTDPSNVLIEFLENYPPVNG